MQKVDQEIEALVRELEKRIKIIVIDSILEFREILKEKKPYEIEEIRK